MNWNSCAMPYGISLINFYGPCRSPQQREVSLPPPRRGSLGVSAAAPGPHCRTQREGGGGVGGGVGRGSAQRHRLWKSGARCLQHLEIAHMTP